MDDNLIEKPEKEYGAFQWFVFVILIPLMFAVTISLVILIVAGVNVFDTAKDFGKKIPYVSTLLKDETKPEDQIQLLEDNVVDLQATNEENQKTIESLNNKIRKRDDQITQLNEEISELKRKLMDNNVEAEKANVKLNEIAKMYEGMSAKKAAEIIPQLSDDEAIMILSRISNSSVSAILEKMDAKAAAKYTGLLSKQNNQN
jgi:flagellar motility protein MotE (MotC chaperone)